MSENITKDTVWTKVDSPYVIEGGVTVLPGVRLTVNPGVIIKEDHNSNLEIQGAFIATSTADDPIYFTSANDDSVKMIGPGTTTPPAPADWENPLYFDPGSEGELSHIFVRYGGEHSCYSGCVDRPMIEVRGTRVSVSHATLSDSAFAGIQVDDGGVLDISDSIFRDMSEGVYVVSGIAHVSSSTFDGVYRGVYATDAASGTVSALTDWWGDRTGPTAPGNPNGRGSLASGVAIIPWLSKRPDVGATSTVDDRIAAPLSLASKIIPVIIVPGLLGSFQYHGAWVLDPIFHIYDDLVDTFLANGYSMGSTLFTLPYDWRKSNAETAALLKKKIDEATSACGCAKVDIVAHSMGGLVARSYIESPDYRADVDKVVFLGTPHQGAPESYLAFEGGQFGPTIWDDVLQIVVTLYARLHGYADALDYIKRYPVASVGEMLPIYDYIRLASTTAFEAYPNGYPVNAFLANLRGRFPLMLDAVDSLNVIGETGSSTVSAIDVGDAGAGSWENGKPVKLEYGPGDGTVPLEGVSLTPQMDRIVPSAHYELPSDAAGLALEFLRSAVVTTTAKKARKPQRIMLVALHSPATMVVTSPDGEQVGLKADGSDVADIPGSFYSGADSEIQMAAIPDPAEGAYKAKVTGTATGGYMLEVDDIGDQGTSTALYVGTTTVSQVADLEFAVSSTSVSEIKPENPVGPDGGEATSSPSADPVPRSEARSLGQSMSQPAIQDVAVASRSGGGPSVARGANVPTAPVHIATSPALPKAPPYEAPPYAGAIASPKKTPAISQGTATDPIAQNTASVYGSIGQRIRKIFEWLVGIVQGSIKWLSDL